jgi:ribosomal protein S6--L-glutamate ligase
VKFHFLLARRNPDVPSRIILDVSDLLRQRGHTVQCSIAEEMLTGLHELPCDDDLYLLKSYTELSLSLAGTLSARGARLINPYEGCAAARNKIVCYQMLREAGVPVPRSWITADLKHLKELLHRFPLILKPYMGWRGEGIQVVRRDKDLSGYQLPSTPLLVQEYIEHDGEDLRLYVAGNEVFGIRKRFSRSSFAVEGEPVRVSPEFCDIALRCGRAFGLKLYGIDIIEGATGPVVVDVNYFPGYKGVAGAAYSVVEAIEKHASSPSKRLSQQMQSDRQVAEVAG